MFLVGLFIGFMAGSLFAALCFSGYIGFGTMTLDDHGERGLAYSIKFEHPEKLLERKSAILKIHRGRVNCDNDKEGE